MNVNKLKSSFSTFKPLLFLIVAVMFVWGCRVSQSQVVSNNSSPNTQTTNTVNISDAKKAIETIEKSLPSTPNPASTPVSDPLNEEEFAIAKFEIKKLKRETLDKQPSEIISKLREDHEDPSRNPKKIKVFVQERDFNRDGENERIIYYRQYSNVGVPRLLVFQKENALWDKCILDLEGSPDNDIPRIEFLTKPNSKDFDIIKTINEVGDWLEVSILRMNESNASYEIIECQKIVGGKKEYTSCR